MHTTVLLLAVGGVLFAAGCGAPSTPTDSDGAASSTIENPAATRIINGTSTPVSGQTTSTTSSTIASAPLGTAESAWPLEGSWLVAPRGDEVAPTPRLFVVFGTLLPEDRAVSIGQADCFVASGIVVNRSDEIIQIGAQRDGDETLVDCDSGVVQPVVLDLIACLQQGCVAETTDDSMRLLDTDGREVAALARSSTDLP